MLTKDKKCTNTQQSVNMPNIKRVTDYIATRSDPYRILTVLESLLKPSVNHPNKRNQESCITFTDIASRIDISGLNQKLSKK